jgi:predicted dehydrogenase
MHKPLKTALLGTGSWASICLQSIRLIPEIEIIGCYSPTQVERDKFSAETGIPAITSEEALLDLPGLEAVLILTPNVLHHDQAIKATERGLHVFVEKPMASNSAQCRAMIEAARQAGVTLFVGHNSRREARFRLMKKMLNNGSIGQPVLTEISYTSEAGLLGNNSGWRHDPEQTPALALTQIGIHAIDILHSIFGVPEELQAWIHNVAMDGGAEDVCLARMKFANNLSASFTNAYSIPRIRTLNIMGTGGNLFSDSETIIQHQKSGSIERKAIAVAQNDTVREELKEFVACCRGERLPETGGMEGLAAMEVMSAMLLSSRTESQIQRISPIKVGP